MLSKRGRQLATLVGSMLLVLAVFWPASAPTENLEIQFAQTSIAGNIGLAIGYLISFID